MKYILLTVICLSLLLGCKDRTKEEGSGDQIKEELKVPVSVEKVELRDLDQFIDISGKLEGIIDITLSSEVNGKVEEINKNLGDWVEKNEQIGRISNKDLELQMKQAEAGVLAAEAALETAELSMKSSEELYSTKSISEAEYKQVKSQFKNALAGLEGAKVSLELSKRALENSRFLAPVSGYISYLSIEVGETISQGMPICSIVDSRNLKIKTGVGESDMSGIAKGQEVYIKAMNSSEITTGKISGVGISPILGTASYPVEIELKNNGNLYPGMVVNIKILSKTYKNVFYTSVNSIISEFDKRFIFIVNNGKVEKIEVELGVIFDQKVIIEKGLNVDDIVVTSGIDNLDNGTKVEIIKNK